MSLHLTYRPGGFEDIEGNESTIKALRSVLEKENRPHAFLFTGPSGCGKTTLARITAKRLGCNIEHDFYEMDSASYRGIDSIRDIRKNMMMGTLSGGSCRVWLLDEVHQLTKDAQTALLKALEDTPRHVYFLLATTDPQKLLPTIKTRCHEFRVGPLSDKELFGLIKKVTRLERKRVSEKAMDMIVDNSLGSPRMALVLLDKIIDLPQADMLAVVEHAAAEENEVIELCQALIKKSGWGKVSKILKGIGGRDPESVRRAVRGYCSSVLMGGVNEQASFIIDTFYDMIYDKAGLVNACFLCVK